MKLATRTWGAGTREIALVHGINGTGELWHDFAELIAAEHDVTVTAVDLRGHGDSRRADSYRLGDFSGDLVDTLPAGLDVIIGHSLGGRVLADAVGRLRPARAVYLDPGFRMTLPATGLGNLLLRRGPGVGALVAALFSHGTPGLSPENRARARRSTARWDRRMTREVLVDLTANPLPVAPPVVPSTVVPSEGSPLLKPAHLDELRAAGWDVRPFPSSKHDMATLNPRGTADLLADLLE